MITKTSTRIGEMNVNSIVTVVEIDGELFSHVTLHDPVELGDELAYVVSRARPYAREITPVKLPFDPTRAPLLNGLDTRILIGWLETEGKHRTLIVPTVDDLQDIRRQAKFRHAIWEDVELRDLHILIRKPWTYGGYFDNWHFNESAVEKYVADAIEAGAEMAWVRNNVPHGVKADWGVVYGLYPLTDFIRDEIGYLPGETATIKGALSVETNRYEPASLLDAYIKAWSAIS